ncbi:MAG: radical SAM protein [Spirochaetaceae bacterium]|nr:radical SAM protein [Spirochaetaceae bacterium]
MLSEKLSNLKKRIYKGVLFFYIRASSWKRLKPRKILRFETDIVSHCNLNCTGCNHFSPLCKEEFVDVNSLARDFARLSELTKRKTENIDIMGGEPLLHPEITKIIELGRKYFDGPINIVTNGILLPKMNEDFWLACKNNNIKIIVTSYPVRLDRKTIKKTAKEYGVKIKIRVQLNNIHTWCRLPKDLNGRQDINKQLKNCLVANFCIFLRDGKLSTCCLPLLIERFNKYFNKNIESSVKDYIDIYKAKNIDEILNFLCRPIPFCRYCKLLDWEVGIDWSISKKEIHEWFDL